MRLTHTYNMEVTLMEITLCSELDHNAWRLHFPNAMYSIPYNVVSFSHMEQVTWTQFTKLGAGRYNHPHVKIWTWKTV